MGLRGSCCRRRHHMLFHGPPGVGKTMLAERVPGLLPDLDVRDALEVSAVHSLAGFNLADELITRPPYSDPHHSASVASIVGGGQRMARPGAISCPTRAFRQCSMRASEHTRARGRLRRQVTYGSYTHHLGGVGDEPLAGTLSGPGLHRGARQSFVEPTTASSPGIAHGPHTRLDSLTPKYAAISLVVM